MVADYQGGQFLSFRLTLSVLRTPMWLGYCTITNTLSFRVLRVLTEKRPRWATCLAI